MGYRFQLLIMGEVIGCPLLSQWAKEGIRMENKSSCRFECHGAANGTELYLSKLSLLHGCLRDVKELPYIITDHSCWSIGQSLHGRQTCSIMGRLGVLLHMDHM